MSIKILFMVGIRGEKAMYSEHIYALRNREIGSRVETGRHGVQSPLKAGEKRISSTST